MPSDPVSPKPVIATTIVDGVGIITLDRPDRANAIHPAMIRGVQRALASWEDEPAVGCIVLTGAGQAFCAGGDVRAGRRRGDDGEPVPVEEATAELLADARTSSMLLGHPKITIAAVNGAAVGAGLALALACDLRIATRSARLIPGWAPLAFTGDYGGAWLLNRLVGPARALEILTSNPTIDAETARELGLVNRVADDPDFDEAWRSWARELAAGPHGAWSGMKANLRDAATLSLDEALPNESARMVRSGRTAEHRAAVRRWLDARRDRADH